MSTVDDTPVAGAARFFLFPAMIFMVIATGAHLHIMSQHQFDVWGVKLS